MQATMFIHLDPRFFSGGSLRLVFNSIAREFPARFHIEITALADEEVLEREAARWRANRGIYILDFVDNEQGRDSRRKLLGRDVAEEKKGLRAYYVRNSDGSATFNYTADPDSGNLTWVDLKGEEPAADLRMELIRAVERGDPDSINSIASHRENLNIGSPAGYTLLMFRPTANKAETVKLLVQLGVPVDAKDKYGGTALIHAAESGDLEAVRTLIGLGADIAARDDVGETALQAAAHKQYPAVVELLADRGASVNTGDRHQTTPLMRAAANADAKSLSVLLSKGADPNARDGGGLTALFYATSYANLKFRATIEVLVNAGADVNAKDARGRTALMYAVDSHQTEKVVTLLGNGADPQIKDGTGASILDLAAGRWGAGDEITQILEATARKR